MSLSGLTGQSRNIDSMINNLTKLLSLFLSFCLIFEQSVFAQSIDLSHYFVRNPAQVIQSDKFRPLHLRYLGYDNLKNDFKLLLDKGDNKKEDLDNPAYIEENTQTLLKYFFIGLALPNEKFWVNLRPDAPDNIIDDDLAKTDIGRIFLEADVQLKKDTAGLTSPQTPEGKVYWDKLYKKAGELFGSENITIPTLTRPWIVSNEVIIREAPDNAYIYKATLKVMLEEDYLSQEAKINSLDPNYQPLTSNYNFSDPRLKELNQYSTQLIKETIIPKLTYQINTSKRYAPLRQVYYSLILAQWFKARYREQRTENRAQRTEKADNYLRLIDSGNLTNLTSSQPYDKQTYFKQYQKSFAEGEYNLSEPIYTPYGQSIRRYMSGGMMLDISSSSLTKIKANNNNIGFLDKFYLKSASSISASSAVFAASLPMKTPAVLSPDMVSKYWDAFKFALEGKGLSLSELRYYIPSEAYAFKKELEGKELKIIFFIIKKNQKQLHSYELYYLSEDIVGYGTNELLSDGTIDLSMHIFKEQRVGHSEDIWEHRLDSLLSIYNGVGNKSITRLLVRPNQFSYVHHQFSYVHLESDIAEGPRALLFYLKIGFRPEDVSIYPKIDNILQELQIRNDEKRFFELGERLKNLGITSMHLYSKVEGKKGPDSIISARPEVDLMEFLIKELQKALSMKNISLSGTTADIGCRDGRYIEVLKSLGAKNIYGVDPDKEDLEEAIRKGLPREQAINLKLEEWSRPPNSIDNMVIFNFIIPFEERDEFLKKAVEFTKPGGTLLITAAENFTYEDILKRISSLVNVIVARKGILLNYNNNYPNKFYIEIHKLKNNISASGSSLTYKDNLGGIAFNALPIQTQTVASSGLNSYSLSRNPLLGIDLDAEWSQIQQIFNAGIRPSIQRLSEYTLAASASPLVEEKTDALRGLLADMLRRDEESEKLKPAEEALKQLLALLESNKLVQELQLAL